MTGAPMKRVYEAPAAVVLHAALDTSVLPRDLLELKRNRAMEYARLVSDSVRSKLFKGTLLTSDVAQFEDTAVERP